MKPRLRCNKPGDWVCWGAGLTAFGQSAEYAYRAWRARLAAWRGAAGGV